VDPRRLARTTLDLVDEKAAVVTALPDLSANGDPPTPCLALRRREAARALGVSERTLWDWTQRQEVPHVRIRGTVLYPVGALRKWLNERAVQAAAGPTSDAQTDGAK